MQSKRARTAIKHWCLLLALPVSLTFALPLEAQNNLISNPSFEDQTTLFPWIAPADAVVEIDDIAVDGNQSLRASDGYIVLQQRINVDDIAGRVMTLSLYAKGMNGAKLGAFVNFRSTNAEGKIQSSTGRLFWNRELGNDWTEIRLTYRFGANRQGPLSIVFYRSNKEGTLWLDNISLTLDGTNTELTSESVSEPGVNLLMNGHFEVDEGIVGFPDFWRETGDAKSFTQTSQATGRFVQIEGSSGGIYQEVDLTNLENRDILFRCQLGGFGSKLNVWIRGQLSGGDRFEIPLVHEFSPEEDWELLEVKVPLEIQGRIETASLFLEKGTEGALWLDDVELSIVGLSKKQTLSMVHEKREWEYLNAHLLDSLLPEQRQETLQKYVQNAISIMEGMDEEGFSKLAGIQEQRHALALEVWQSASNGKSIMTMPTLPMDRQDPSLGPLSFLQNENSSASHIVGLVGWETPIGFAVANTSSKPLQLSLRIRSNGHLVSANVRQQRFLDTWYTRGRTRLADPMTLLSSGVDDVVNFEIQPSESAQFYIEVEGLKPGNNDVHVEIWQDNELLSNIPFLVELLEAPISDDTLEPFDYKAFMYLGHPLAARNPEAILESLVNIGATSFEWELMPRPQIDADGKLKSLDFGVNERWMNLVSQTNLTPALFFEPRTRTWAKPDGTPIPQMSPKWKDIYVQIFQGFFELASKHGFAEEDFYVLVRDEPYSRDYENRPDERVQLAVGMFKFFRENFPTAPTMVTYTDYAFYDDIKAMQPHVDVALPLWPYRDRWLRFSPPGRIPRDEFVNEILPYLLESQENDGAAIWSYAITGGKSSGVVPFHLGYPLIAAKMGLTGASHWAYSLPKGSSWDDTDGTGVDYSLIYDGTENVRENIDWNPTREVIVPSIRWFALRQGLRDARVYLSVKKKMEERSDDDPLKQRFLNFEQALKTVGGSSGFGEGLQSWSAHFRLPISEEQVSDEEYWELRQELLRIYHESL